MALLDNLYENRAVIYGTVFKVGIVSVDSLDGEDERAIEFRRAVEKERPAIPSNWLRF